MSEEFAKQYEGNGFITFPQAAEILGYKNPLSLYPLIREGKLTKYKVLNKSFLKREEVEKLLTPTPEEN